MADITGFFLSVYIVVVVTCHAFVAAIIRTLVASILANPMCSVLD